MFYRLQNTVRRFMVGRYGTDGLNRFLAVTYLVLWVLSRCFSRGWVGFALSAVATAVFVWFVFRTLSRNIPRRQAENQWFYGWWYPTREWLRHQKDRIRDVKVCRYRRCPTCRAWLRLPIKKGRRTVTCSRCHTPFKAFFL